MDIDEAEAEPEIPVYVVPPSQPADTTASPPAAGPTTQTPAADPLANADPVDDAPTEPDPDSAPMTEPEPEPEETLPEPGSIVDFEIAQGTGTGPWNTADDPVVAYVGQVLRITNFDDRDHQMHATDDAPVPHGNVLRPGQSAEYVVSSPAAIGDQADMWDHNDGRNAAFWVEALEYPTQ